jgi:hypothetical protein
MIFRLPVALNCSLMPRKKATSSIQEVLSISINYRKKLSSQYSIIFRSMIGYRNYRQCARIGG